MSDEQTTPADIARATKAAALLPKGEGPRRECDVRRLSARKLRRLARKLEANRG